MGDRLEHTASQLNRLGDLVADFVAQYLSDLEELDVSPASITPEEVQKSLSEPLPLEAQELDEVWSDFQDSVVDQSVRVGHPQFLAWIRTSPLGGAVFAEALAAALNQSVAVWDGAPAATEVEKMVIQWLIEISGYDPQGGGILTSGGSMANFTGLLAALSSVFPRVREQGVRDGPPLAVYLTSQTHYSVHKAVEMMGVGRKAIRTVPVDDDLRMDAEALAARIRGDRQKGTQPLAVVATLGTTSTGSCDDLLSLGRVCREEKVWLHVDGAYGGVAGLIPGKRHLVRGLSEADSFVLDPHKNLFMPFEAGCLLVRDLDHLRSAFAVRTDYLPNTEGGLIREQSLRHHFRDYGPQLSRGFRALKIYLTLKLYGLNDIAKEIAREYDLAEKFAGMIHRAEDFETLADVALGVVAFRYLPRDTMDRERVNAFNAEMVEELQRRGKVFLSKIVVQGQVGFRACFVSHRTRSSHLQGVLDEVREVARVVQGMGE
ncbi:MAG: pyridoxal-dependent decarboxylase [Anaerolineales bacterium]